MKTGYDVIIRPIITENTMDMAADKKYAFKVAKEANKTEVRKAVEEIFGVDVAKVNIMNVSGKRKRLGRTFGTTSSYKKAVVTLTPDSKEIEIFQDM
ncbi:MAG: 50S ribosomal protein L23 [Mogibacterium sp.]|nr:50S ribosomal protein L23 [Mogibacterium sp.]